MDWSNCFIDANVFIRHLAQDNKLHADLATKVFDDLAEGKRSAKINTLLLHEVIYVLEKVYGFPRSKIANAIRKLLELVTLEVVDLDKQSVFNALEDYTEHTSIDFPDCIYRQITLNENLKIITFDQHFKKFGIQPFTG